MRMDDPERPRAQPPSRCTARRFARARCDEARALRAVSRRVRCSKAGRSRLRFGSRVAGKGETRTHTQQARDVGSVVWGRASLHSVCVCVWRKEIALRARVLGARNFEHTKARWPASRAAQAITGAIRPDPQPHWRYYRPPPRLTPRAGDLVEPRTELHCQPSLGAQRALEGPNRRRTSPLGRLDAAARRRPVRAPRAGPGCGP